MALVRGLPDRGGHRRRDVGAGAAGRRRPARPRGDARRDHRAHPARARLHPQQPDRPGGPRRTSWTRSWTGCPRTCWWSSTRPTSSSSPTRTPPTASRRTGSGPTSRCCARSRKAYGLAGLRVGYAVAHEPVAQALRKTAVPFGVSDIAQQAAIASLDAYDELQVRVDALVAERARVVAALRAQGWAVPQTEANFVWLPLGDQHARLRRGGGRGGSGRAAVRRRGRALHRRRDGGQRPAGRGRRAVPLPQPRGELRSGSRPN